MSPIVTHGMIWPFSSTGGYEWLIVLAVAVLLFGKRLPELGRMIGRTLVNFRHGVTEMKDEIARATDTAPSSNRQDSTPSGSTTPDAPPPTGAADPVIPTTETPEDTTPPESTPPPPPPEPPA